MSTEDDPDNPVGLTGARFGGASGRWRFARRRATGGGAVVAPVGGSGAVPAPREAATATIPVRTEAALAVHHAGARAHGAPEAGAATAGAAGAAGPGPAAASDEGSVVGQTGARFGGNRRRAGPDRAEEEAAPVRPTVPEALVEDEDEPEERGGLSSFVRPYVLTRGRTRSSFELPIEALVSAVPQAVGGGLPAGLTGEHEIVLGLCREARSVAELAAVARVPLGVARVLVGDLAGAGAVAVHRSAGAEGPDLALMERVLSGLRRL